MNKSQLVFTDNDTCIKIFRKDPLSTINECDRVRGINQVTMNKILCRKEEILIANCILLNMK